jgi:RNA polymerase sigma-70 factor (ECF subfamily)
MSEERIEAIQTRWSLVRNAHLEGRPESIAEMRQILVLRYAPAVKRYVGAIVRDSDDADELAQDVMLRLMRGDFAGADPSKGRFRDLLKTAIRNMIRNHWEKKNRRRATDAGLDEVHDHSEQEQESDWTAAWQRSVLDHTWARMLAEDGGQPSPAYQLLKLRAEFPEASSEELAERLGKQLRTEIRPDNCRQMLRRARGKFAQHLLDEVRAGLDDESDYRVQEELASLGLLPWFKDLI